MLTRLYSTACMVLRHIDQLAQSYLRLETAPFFFTFAADIATVTILRLLKGSTAQYLDFEQAKETFFLGVNILKRSSLESNDMANRMVLILSQLWKSDKAFKNPDGTEHTELRIRTRLAMSPIFDAIWWWREEFAGQQGAYPVEPSRTRVSGMSLQLLRSAVPLTEHQRHRNDTARCDGRPQPPGVQQYHSTRAAISRDGQLPRRSIAGGAWMDI